MASRGNHELVAYRVEEEIEEDDDDDGEPEGWDDWNGDDDEGGEGGSGSDFLCLFCDSKYSSCDSLFEHCAKVHRFDFHRIRKDLSLDFYGSFKLINYIRSQVADNKCWSCGLTCQSNKDLQNHLHDTVNFKDIKCLWDDERYLKPFIQDDSLLYSFDESEEIEDEQFTPINEEELVGDLKNSEEICGGDQNTVEKMVLNADDFDMTSVKGTTNSVNDIDSPSSWDKDLINDKDSRGFLSSNDKNQEGHLTSISSSRLAKHVMKVNENYFGAYSSFGIHREMLSDKVRMDAYGNAILKNPSLLKGAVVMDVGCGTGILSLFAAQAGASRVIAIEASAKMAAVASKVANDNGLLHCKNQSQADGLQKGVIEVVQGMVEEVDKNVELQPQSVDVLLSEWMGYCLLYESMLSSVLYARDRWLKPGGAILPDTATIFVAGFGKGGTSLPFWENVCGFDMSCIGKELVNDAAQFPIVDVLDYEDLVTDSVILQTFDLATMKPNQVDFTATATLEPMLNSSHTKHLDSKTGCCWCYGVVLWFETGFTSRFCQETPAVLSTSPHTPKTHWSQTILTFREPIAMSYEKANAGKVAAIGTNVYPAVKIDLRVSIVRSTEHRSIDISLEAVGVGTDGRRRSWPAQLFSLQ
ncbi:probable protein arginine N-methyltransferase 3 [Prosopis cineraria]|uniref:probable protein arginine N-methyltransferase 3 n=1 Tax=Prosopis cineraria TaxID=364024 RepID=UPI0024104F6C|nr:probable protein arginine N-methyltransferase 3 [Prosopis cineraria]